MLRKDIKDNMQNPANRLIKKGAFLRIKDLTQCDKNKYVNLTGKPKYFLHSVFKILLYSII
jgi:hypothetical protein